MFKSLPLSLIIYLIILIALLLLEFIVHGHAYFSAASIWGFNAWFGFGVTACFIIVARIIRAFIRRESCYYD